MVENKKLQPEEGGLKRGRIVRDYTDPGGKWVLTGICVVRKSTRREEKTHVNFCLEFSATHPLF